MSASPAQRWNGWYFDGRTAKRTAVTVRVLRDGLAVIPDDGGSHWWPYDGIRLTPRAHTGDPVRFERGGDPPELLTVPDAGILVAIRAANPQAVKRFPLPARRGAWVAVTLITAFGLVLLVWGIYTWGIPALADAVAGRLPVAWEEQLGRAVVDELAPAGRHCQNAEQRAALAQMLQMLTAAGPPTPYRYTLIVVDDGTANAFAAPGGYLVFTRGILQLTDRPEEAAGVMAHEIQHVVQRHVTKLLVRELSLRALVSLATGDLGGLGSALDAARTLDRLRYQRADESSADREAVRLLAAARIDPRGMVTVLQKMQQSTAAALEPPAYLSTHPALDERIATLQRLADETPLDPLPLLPESRWSELTQACGL